MTSKTAKHFTRNYNWKEVNNLFCYDVAFPERLSRKQQVLRLYKNSLRRVFEIEMKGEKYSDITGYAKGLREIREDFEKLKFAKTDKDVTDMLDKYEDFNEENFDVNAFFRDNVPYEWRNIKGVHHFSEGMLASDPHGYYSPNEYTYYEPPKEFEFRDTLPHEPITINFEDHNEDGWEKVDINSSNIEELKAPIQESFKEEVEKLKLQYSSEVNMWEKNNKL